MSVLCHGSSVLFCFTDTGALLAITPLLGMLTKAPARHSLVSHMPRKPDCDDIHRQKSYGPLAQEQTIGLAPSNLCPGWRCHFHFHFQDPGADGPVIQAASTRALSAGTTLDGVFAMLAEAAPSLRAPVLIFTYYNPIMARGLDRFCRQARDAGVSGAPRPLRPRPFLDA